MKKDPITTFPTSKAFTGFPHLLKRQFKDSSQTFSAVFHQIEGGPNMTEFMTRVKPIYDYNTKKFV